MGNPDSKLSELLDVVKSWVTRRSEPANVSKDFWMPDQSCRVCYECDSQFTVFNRRHHCRLCGLVFCAKCTTNTIPASSDESRTGHEDSERIRVCNYCFKYWEQSTGAVDNGTPHAPSPGLSSSPSATSLASTKSSCTCNSSSGTVGSTPYSTGPYQHVPCASCISPQQFEQMDPLSVNQENVTSGRNTNPPTSPVVNSAPNQLEFSMNRGDDEDDDSRVYRSDSETRHYLQANDYYGALNMDEIDHTYGSREVDSDRESIHRKSLSCSQLPENFDSQGVEKIKDLQEEAHEGENGDECEPPLYDEEATGYEPMDFENEGLLYIPPEPEDEEDEREAILFDDDEEEGGTGEWGYLRSSNSFGSGEYRSRDKLSEEYRKAMKNVVEGHFRALVAQLLQVENLPVGDENDRESWLEIVTSLSWEAATLLKPDTSKGGGMDPGGYVKVKCIACGQRSESIMVKGVVCKKNVANRRMTSKIDKPRFLILGGALEYQRVANHLSSVDTLLQQEMDHLKMAVAKIDAHHPNVLLVEKSVSRYAQDYLLAKGISLVLNIKRPLLERIARCTGAQIVLSTDHLTLQKLGCCDTFHVEKFLEEHGSAGQGGKRLPKTLMFFDGCPKPSGCTILLKGANGDDLKKVKHVVQYGVFAAYHLALETSFLADEGASLPELPLKSPIAVALPGRPSSIDRSISTIPGFKIPGNGKPSCPQPNSEPQKSRKGLLSDRVPTTNMDSMSKLEGVHPNSLPGCLRSWTPDLQPSSGTIEATGSSISLLPIVQDVSYSYQNEPSPKHALEEEIKVSSQESVQANPRASVANDHEVSNFFGTSKPSRQVGGYIFTDVDALATNHHGIPELVSLKQDSSNNNEEMGSSKEEFPPSPSDHQSILVSLSTRCVWKGTVCEPAHLVRIKYYGSSDKPLGRFLHDHLFDQSCHCPSCDMASEAHVRCYTHRQGSLTISVKKSSEFILPGEQEGKIWMWHRCLRCPRIRGFPPATRRVVMSDAAWGLSFGKFLELSFSNHAAASRVASCGHSLHRDCLRFYGFGRMIACLRYAAIDIHSVYLPPPKIEFNYDNQEWIQKEANEVISRAEQLFTEVDNALPQFSERIGVRSEDGGMKANESRAHISELEGILQNDKEEFEESLQRALRKEVKLGFPAIDILEINKLRRQILFHSYVWDQRLIHVASSFNNNFQEGMSSFVPKLKEKTVSSVKKLEVNATSKPSKGFSSCDSFLPEVKPDMHRNLGGICGDISEAHRVYQERGLHQDLNHKEADHFLSSCESVGDNPEPQESAKVVRRALSDGEFPKMANISNTFDAAWTGENHPANVKEYSNSLPDPSLVDSSTTVNLATVSTAEQVGAEVARSLSSVSSTKGTENMESSKSWVGMPFSNFYSSFNNNSLLNAQKLSVPEYSPTYVLSCRELERLSGARLLLPVGANDTVVPVYDDEPTSVIAYALVSSDYHAQISEFERLRDTDSAALLFDSTSRPPVNSFDDTSSDRDRSLGSTDERILPTSRSRGSQVLDPLSYTKDLHAKVCFTDDGPIGKVKYTVTCYYAKRFDALRRICCPSELDFIRSLSRCKKWGAQGGKSNVFFAKTLDDRFIIKQVTKTELESFIKFGPAYFKYLSESVSTRSPNPTCLAKILGIYQVSSKYLKGGKESKIDVLVMENLLFRRNITQLYDLKGSSRSRYNPDTSGSNKVLLDQNLIEAMPTSPIFVGNRAKRLLGRAVWNDTQFLASVDVMDYSLLVGVDGEKHELVLGIIDFMRQYTWDKHLETWVKISGILGRSKNTTPTVISPQQYKKRFRTAMMTYFLVVPDQWSPPTIIHGESQSDLCEENSQGGISLD